MISEAVEGIRNSMKIYENELAFSKTMLTDSTAERVTKKRPVKNVQAKKSKASIQDIQETSTTIVSQPAANKTSPSTL